MKKLTALSALIALALTACGQPTGDTGPIKIGFIGPLTGEVAGLGTDILHGAQMKLEEVNAAGGINGRQVELIAEDGRCNGTDAASAAQKLISIDKVIAIHGGECSGETMAIAPIAEEARIVIISPASSHPEITNIGDFIFRDYPSDAIKTRAMANYFAEKDFDQISIITENADFTVGFRDALKKDVGEDSIVFDELVEPGTKDFRTLLARLKNIEFDVIVLNVNSPANIATLLKQAREQGLEQLAISHDLGDSIEIPKLIGEQAEGMQVINVPTLDKDSIFGQKFIANYGQPQANLAWAGYGNDVMGILIDAITAAGTDGSAIRDYLYAMKPYEDGTIAKTHFDENGDVIGINYVLREIQNGEFVTVSEIDVE